MSELEQSRDTNRRLNRENQALSKAVAELYTEIEKLRRERRDLRGKLERHIGYCNDHKETISRLDRELRNLKV